MSTIAALDRSDHALHPHGHRLFIFSAVALTFFGLVAGGANSALVSSIIASCQLLLAGVLLLLLGTRSEETRSPVLALAAFGIALTLGALPLLIRLPGILAPDLIPAVLLKLAGYAATTITAFVLAATASGRRLMIGALTVGGLIFALWTIGSGLLQSTDSITAPHYHATGRFMGSLENANAMASVAGVLVLLGVGSAIGAWPETGLYDISARNAWSLGISLALIVLSIAIIGLAESRLTVLIVIVLALALVAPYRAHSQRHLTRTVIAALGLSVLVFGWRVVDRFGAVRHDWDARLSVYERLAAQVANSPVTGHGLGSFREVNIRSLTDSAGWDWGAAHNIILQSLIEGGLLFTIAIAATLCTILAMCVAGRERRRDDPLVRACFYAILLILGVAMIDIPLDVPAVAGLWSLLLGLVWRASMTIPKLIAHDEGRGRFT